MGQSLLFLLVTITNVINIKEQRRIRRQFQVPLSPSCNKHRGDLSQRAANQFLEPVPFRAAQEHKEGDHYCTNTNPVTPFPAQVVLDIDKSGDCGQRSKADKEKEPVEEVCHLRSFFFVRVIELVRA